MLKKPQSTTFKFVLDNEQLFSNLDHLKLNDYQRFIKVGNIGKQIQQLSKADQYKQLQALIDNNFFNIQYMKIQIQDAFSSALHLRNQNTIQYYLKNGISLEQLQPSCILQICYSLEYLKHDPPIDLLKLLLQYGGNVRYCSQDNSDTPLHLCAKYGNVEFMKLILEYGADVNAANDQKMTPLGVAIAHKQNHAIEYLRSKNASQKWNV